MKRLFLVTGVLVAMMALSAGCAAKAQPAAVPQNITGELRYLSIPLEGGDATLTVQTPQGPQTIQLASNTTYSLDGQVCKLDEIGKVLAEGGTTYNCSVVIDPCEPEGFVARFLSVFTVVK